MCLSLHTRGTHARSPDEETRAPRERERERAGKKRRRRGPAVTCARLERERERRKEKRFRIEKKRTRVTHKEGQHSARTHTLQHTKLRVQGSCLSHPPELDGRREREEKGTEKTLIAAAAGWAHPHPRSRAPPPAPGCGAPAHSHRTTGTAPPRCPRTSHIRRLRRTSACRGRRRGPRPSRSRRRGRPGENGESVEGSVCVSAMCECAGAAEAEAEAEPRGARRAALERRLRGAAGRRGAARLAGRLKKKAAEGLRFGRLPRRHLCLSPAKRVVQDWRNTREGGTRPCAVPNAAQRGRDRHLACSAWGRCGAPFRLAHLRRHLAATGPAAAVLTPASEDEGGRQASDSQFSDSEPRVERGQRRPPAGSRSGNGGARRAGPQRAAAAARGAGAGRGPGMRGGRDGGHRKTVCVRVRELGRAVCESRRKREVRRRGFSVFNLPPFPLQASEGPPSVRPAD